MFCFKCGFDCGNGGWKFCPSCGTNLEEISKALSGGAEEYIPNDGGIPVEENPFADSESMDWLENISYEDFEYEEREAPAKRVGVKTEPAAIMKVPCKANFDNDFKEKKVRYSAYDPATSQLEITIPSDGEQEYIDPKTRLFKAFDILDAKTQKPVLGLRDIAAYYLAKNGIYYAKLEGGLYFMHVSGETKKLEDVKDVLSMEYNASKNALEVTVVTGISHLGNETREECGGWYENTYAIYGVSTKIITVAV